MKGLNNIKSFSEIKNDAAKRIKCIPDTHKSDYLELYILNREKTRLSQELFTLEKRRGNAKGQLKNITKNMNQIRNRTLDNDEELTNKKSPLKQIKVMRVNY